MPTPSNFVSQYSITQGRQVSIRFTYADSTARANDTRTDGPSSMAAEALSANDIGSFAHQLDDDTFYFLAEVSPSLVWIRVDIGESSVVDIVVRKDSAGTINKGEVIYFTSWNAGLDIPLVELAKADSASTMPSFGMALASFTDSTNGVIRVIGIVDEIDTQTPGWSLGDTLYVSSTVAGALVNSRPTGETTEVQQFGIVGQIDLTDGNVGVSGAKRSNSLPNLGQDKIWVGDASAFPVAVDKSTLSGGVQGSNFAFSTTVAMADPGSGIFRTNNADQTLANQLAVSSTSGTGLDLSSILADLKSGDFFYAEQKSASGRFQLYRVTGAPTDNSTWVQIPVAFDNGGTALQNTEACILVFSFTGASGVTAHGALSGLTPGDAGHTDLQLRSEKNAGGGYVGLTAGSKISNGAFQVYGDTGNTAIEGTNTRVPTQAENDALQGTSGAPSGSNRYVTNSDSRLTDSLSGQAWGFDGASVVMGDPTSGLWRANDADQTLATALAISANSNTGIDVSSPLAGLKAGDFIQIEDRVDAGQYQLYQVTGTPTDNTTWLEIPVSHDNGGTAIEDGDLCGFGFYFTGLDPLEFPTGYVDGMAVKWTSVTQLTIDVGVSRDDTDDFDLVLDLPAVVDITVTGAGGREVADAEDPNAWYYVWVIGDSTGSNPTDSFMSKTASPTLPGGYDRKRLRILARNASGDLFEYVVRGKGSRTIVWYDEDRNSPPQRITSGGGATGWSTVNGAIVLPPVLHDGIFTVQQTSGSIGTHFRPNGFTDTGGNHFLRPGASDQFRLPISDSQLQYMNTGGGGSVSIDVTGWEADF